MSHPRLICFRHSFLTLFFFHFTTSLANNSHFLIFYPANVLLFQPTHSLGISKKLLYCRWLTYALHIARSYSTGKKHVTQIRYSHIYPILGNTKLFQNIRNTNLNFTIILFLIEPNEYITPSANGASLPPNTMEALSVIEMATYDSGLPVDVATSLDSSRRMDDLESFRFTLVVIINDLWILWTSRDRESEEGGDLVAVLPYITRTSSV